MFHTGHLYFFHVLQPYFFGVKYHPLGLGLILVSQDPLILGDILVSKDPLGHRRPFSFFRLGPMFFSCVGGWTRDFGGH